MQKQIQKENKGYRMGNMLISEKEMLEIIKETRELIGDFNMNMLVNWKA